MIPSVFGQPLNPAVGRQTLLQADDLWAKASLHDEKEAKPVAVLCNETRMGLFFWTFYK